MGAIIFGIIFLSAMLIYPAGCIAVWFFKFRKKMTYTEFERRYHL